MADVEFKDVDKIYDNGVQAVFDLSLKIQDGEFLVLVGPSGCGKTTALRMVAGLEDISGGTITIGERVVNDLTPKERDIAMVFQNYALYPHLSVGDNIAFGLRLRKTPKATMDERVQWAARLLGLTQYLDRRPKELSGGQRQRVAMGRAIVREPQVFLMDEPLSNLDAKLRVQMRAEIGHLQRELGTTTIYVTHDQTEAMTMGDHVAVMRKGELQQMDTPQKLYSDPKNLFVASFIGSPSMNLVEAQIERRNGDLVANLGDQELGIPATLAASHPVLAGYVGRKVAMGIRPEQIDDAAFVRDRAEGDRLRGRVLLTEALGAEVLVHVEVGGKPVVTDDVLEGTAEVDEALVDDLTLKAADEQTTLVGRFHAESEVRPNHIVEMVVDTNKLQFFDLETGSTIRDQAGRA
jgi:multiple sugar transport system ATP-binding protein